MALPEARQPVNNPAEAQAQIDAIVINAADLITAIEQAGERQAWQIAVERQHSIGATSITHLEVSTPLYAYLIHSDIKTEEQARSVNTLDLQITRQKDLISQLEAAVDRSSTPRDQRSGDKRKLAQANNELARLKTAYINAAGIQIIKIPQFPPDPQKPDDGQSLDTPLYHRIVNSDSNNDQPAPSSDHLGTAITSAAGASMLLTPHVAQIDLSQTPDPQPAAHVQQQQLAEQPVVLPISQDLQNVANLLKSSQVSYDPESGNYEAIYEKDGKTYKLVMTDEQYALLQKPSKQSQPDQAEETPEPTRSASGSALPNPIYLPFALRGKPDNQQTPTNPPPPTTPGTATATATPSPTKNPPTASATATRELPTATAEPSATATETAVNIEWILSEDTRAVSSLSGFAGSDATMYMDAEQTGAGKPVKYLATETLTQERYPNIPASFLGRQYHLVQNSTGQTFWIEADKYPVAQEQQKPSEQLMQGLHTDLAPPDVHCSLNALNKANKRLQMEIAVPISTTRSFTLPLSADITRPDNGSCSIDLTTDTGTPLSLLVDNQGLSAKADNDPENPQTVNLLPGDLTNVNLTIRVERGQEGDLVTISANRPDGKLEDLAVIPYEHGFTGSALRLKLTASNANIKLTNAPLQQDFEPVNPDELEWVNKINGGIYYMTDERVKIGIDGVPDTRFVKHGGVQFMDLNRSQYNVNELIQERFDYDGLRHELTLMKHYGIDTALPIDLSDPFASTEQHREFINLMTAAAEEFGFPIVVQLFDSAGQADIDENVFPLFPDNSTDPPTLPKNADECAINALKSFSDNLYVPVDLEMGNQFQTSLAVNRGLQRLDMFIRSGFMPRLIHTRFTFCSPSIARQLAEGINSRDIPTIHTDADNNHATNLREVGEICRRHNCNGVSLVHGGSIPDKLKNRALHGGFEKPISYNEMTSNGMPVVGTPLDDFLNPFMDDK